MTLLVIISLVITICAMEAGFRILGIQALPDAERTEMRYNVNSMGLRDYEYGYDKEDGVFRIVATGDSFTYGTGVASLEHIFLKRLEKALNDCGG